MSGEALGISPYLWPENPKRYAHSFSNYSGAASVELGYDDVEEIITAAYAVMDVTTDAGDGHKTDEAWSQLLNLLGHVQRHTLPEYWGALRDGKPVPCTENDAVMAL